MARKKRAKFSSNHLLIAASALLIALILVLVQFLPKTSLNVLARRDTTPPVVSFISPVEGEVIGDGENRLLQVYVSAQMTDDNSVRRAYLDLDGKEIAGFSMYPQGAEIFNAVMFMPYYENGEHILSVRAYDSRDNVGRTSINVSFNNGPKTDFEAPGVTINSPIDGSVLKKRTQYPLKYSVIGDDAAVVIVNYIQRSKKTGEWVYTPVCKGPAKEENTCYFWTKAGAEIMLEAQVYDFEENMSSDTVTYTVK